MPTFSAESREKLINRLQRLEGQVRGICRMIEEGRDCQDVLTQLAAIRGAAHQASIVAVREYAVNCLTDPEAQVSPDETIARVVNTLRHLPY
jgi:CsoR family transcriptional regulator, copper-sensing transcriptional repressor